MNTRNEVLRKVVATIAEALSVPESEIFQDTRVAEDLNADSMDVVTIAISLDDLFNVELDLADLPEHGVTVAWIVDYIQGKLK